MMVSGPKKNRKETGAVFMCNMLVMNVLYVALSL